MSDADAGKSEGAAPLFVLSFGARDALAALATGAGWHVVAARRADDAERRFLMSGAEIALVDARGAAAEALAAARALGDMIAATGNAMLVLLDAATNVADFYDAGATHFLSEPSETSLLHALRFAERHVRRVAMHHGARVAALLGWRADRATRTVTLSPALAALLGCAGTIGWRGALRMIAPAERRGVLDRIRRLERPGDATAIVHDLAGLGRIIEHLQLDSAGAVEAMVEPVQADERPVSGMRDGAAARRWLDRRLNRGAATGVVLVALTRFDLVNAAHGRAAGDTLLAAAASRIDRIARDLGTAVAARVGGSEFLVAADGSAEHLRLFAERLASELGRPFPIGALSATVGCRIGIANAGAGENSASLIRRASEALAEAKMSDGAIIRTAGGEADDAAPIETLAIDLRHALERDEIEILFQPQVAITAARIVGVEALARWRHPRFGALGAETLFAAAERADLASAVSDYIQGLALERAAAWPHGLSNLRLAINVTAADIARPGFADLLLDRVDTSGFPRRRLTVEITESGLIDDLAGAAALLAALRGAGLRIAIDDFGTGYSSLAYLKALPLDYLKVDKRLSQDIAGSARDRVVVRGVIDMARSLGLTVIAEGVETAEQLDLLAKEGCQLYQGFLCAGPLTSDALAELVGEG